MGIFLATSITILALYFFFDLLIWAIRVDLGTYKPRNRHEREYEEDEDDEWDIEEEWEKEDRARWEANHRK